MNFLKGFQKVAAPQAPIISVGKDFFSQAKAKALKEGYSHIDTQKKYLERIGAIKKPAPIKLSPRRT